MPKHYVYRVDHDLGFAPHVEGGICTVCGCKSTSVERWATMGSFVVGLGGLGTRHPDAIIYAMRVEATPTLGEFIKRYPRRSRYLINIGISLDAPVLFSRNYYYFGDHAVALPRSLRHIIFDRQGCKKLTEDDVLSLERFLSRRYSIGRHGRPNNALGVLPSNASCGCSARIG
jgi:hypothetical protein